jgi:Tfp pilus assembly protein PilO
MKPSVITPAIIKQHVLLICLVFAGTFLALYFIQTRKVTPLIKSLTIENASARQQLAYQQNQLATRQAMDLPAMRRAVDEARERLRTAKIGEVKGGPPFLDATNQPKVAAFQSLISNCAVENRLFIRKHSALNEADKKLKDMIVRGLEVRGTFKDLHRFIEALGELPHRVIILSLEISLDPQAPGRLNAVLRYSV